MAQAKGAAGSRREFLLLILAVVFLAATLGVYVYTQETARHDQEYVNLARSAQQQATDLGKLGADASRGITPDFRLLEGAQAMVDDDLYDRVPKPELLISAHVFPVWPAGTVAVRAGRRMAGSDQLDVTLHGVGGHGSAPHNTIDPVVMGARSVMAYQTIVSRNVDPQKPAVLTVGASQIGEANNVIPASGTLKLNLRWYQKPVREQMLEAIKRETNGIARAAGVADDKMPEYTLKGYSEPVYNDEALAQQAQKTLAAGLGKEAVMPGFPPVMGSEDFPMLVAGIEDAQTLFMEVGGGAPDVMKNYMATGELPPMNHNPKFEIINPRLAITTAVKANSLLLLDALARN